MKFQCEKYIEQIHLAIDGDLSEEAQVAFTSHLAECAECRDEYTFMKNILGETANLPRSIQPDRDLWSGIQSRIDVTSKSAEVVPFPKSAIRRWAPLMAAAAVFLVIAGLNYSKTTPPVSPVAYNPTTATLATVPNEELESLESQYAEARSALMQALDDRKGEMPEDLAATIEENLNIIENAVVDINRALEENPENPELERMLHAAYQSEVTLLQAVVGVERDES